jgi:hypothetical protein
MHEAEFQLEASTWFVVEVNGRLQPSVAGGNGKEGRAGRCAPGICGQRAALPTRRIKDFKLVFCPGNNWH